MNPRIQTALVIVLVLLTGCDNAFTPEYTLAWEPPVVNSVVVSEGRTYSEIIFSDQNRTGSVRTIDFSEIKQMYISSNPIYTAKIDSMKGPSNTLNFSIPEDSNVRLYIMPARLPFESEIHVQQRILGTPFIQRQTGGITIFEGMVQAGTHNIRIFPEEYPSGMYIYYLEAGEEIFSREMYLAHTCEEALPQLRQFIADCIYGRDN